MRYWGDGRELNVVKLIRNTKVRDISEDVVGSVMTSTPEDRSPIPRPLRKGENEGRLLGGILVRGSDDASPRNVDPGRHMPASRAASRGRHESCSHTLAHRGRR